METETPEESSEFRHCVLARTQQNNKTNRTIRGGLEYRVTTLMQTEEHFIFHLDFIYEMDFMMEVGRSNGTIPSRGVNHFCRTP